MVDFCRPSHIDCVSDVYANYMLGVQVVKTINLQYNSLSHIHSLTSVFFRLKKVWLVGHTREKCWYKFGWNPLRNEWVIGQTSECITREFENNFCSSHKVSQTHKKVCNENERRRWSMWKFFWWKEGVYKAHAENSGHAWISTSFRSMILDTMKVLYERMFASGWFFFVETRMSAINGW